VAEYLVLKESIKSIRIEALDREILLAFYSEKFLATLPL
jgi:hypothetical protein